VLDKESDAGWGTTKANSGIIHPGYAGERNSLKYKISHKGNRLFRKNADELGIHIKNIGSMLNIFHDYQMGTLENFLEQGRASGLSGLKIITDRQKIKDLEPNISSNVRAALFAGETCIISPYGAAISIYENALMNGVNFYFDNEVKSIEHITDQSGRKLFMIKTKNHSPYQPDYIFQSEIVINAAGVDSAEIANMIGDDSFKIKACRGQYILFDSEAGNFVKHVNFKLPDSSKSKTKGLLVTPTVSGNFFVGPNYEHITGRDLSTTSKSLDEVKENASKMFDNIPFGKAITEFAGLRAVSDSGDFIISNSAVNKNFINVAGIQSPGLTCAFIIAEMVPEILKNTGIKMVKNRKYIPENKNIERRIIKNDAAVNKSADTDDTQKYEIVCRCEKVTEAEIVDAVRKGASTVDGIKFRTRAGMGRCQGGYCLLKVMRIISRELKIPFEKITKCGKDSYIAKYKI
jgi:glycerol-3-phosphate dehydrogenase